MPILLLANEALLLYSNLGDGATVHVQIFDGDQPAGQGRSVESAPLYTITLGRSIKDMWNAKAYFTSLLIAGACVRVFGMCTSRGVSHRTIFDRSLCPTPPRLIPTLLPFLHSITHTVFAGAWPHIKSLASFLCWVLDGRRLGRDARRVLLTLAYVLQKLSHVETFVLVRG